VGFAQIEAPTLASPHDCSEVPAPQNDEDEIVDYEPSPMREDMNVNIIYLSSVDYSLVGDDKVSEMSFHPRDDIFQKPRDSENHLKPLYIQEHLDGTPISRMLVDGGAVINLMSYSLFKKMSKSNEELIRTNMTINDIGGGDPIGAKGVASMELTMGSNILVIAFSIAEVQGNYNVILGQDWIHANSCVPSTLHQFLIQCVTDDVEIVHADKSACVAMADSTVLTHVDVRCLSSLDLSDHDFLSVSKDGFVPVNVKPVENWLNHTSC
jgi:hypothetical protein